MRWQARRGPGGSEVGSGKQAAVAVKAAEVHDPNDPFRLNSFLPAYQQLGRSQTSQDDQVHRSRRATSGREEQEEQQQSDSLIQQQDSRRAADEEMRQRQQTEHGAGLKAQVSMHEPTAGSMWTDDCSIAGSQGSTGTRANDESTDGTRTRAHQVGTWVTIRGMQKVHYNGLVGQIDEIDEKHLQGELDRVVVRVMYEGEMQGLLIQRHCAGIRERQDGHGGKDVGNYEIVLVPASQEVGEPEVQMKVQRFNQGHSEKDGNDGAHAEEGGKSDGEQSMSSSRSERPAIA